MKPTTYHAPPPGYISPTKTGCATCGDKVILVPVSGGHKWIHSTVTLNAEPHDVDLGRPWFDVGTGEWHNGTP